MAGTMKKGTDQMWKEIKAMERKEQKGKKRTYSDYDLYYDDDFFWDDYVQKNRAGDIYVTATKVC